MNNKERNWAQGRRKKLRKKKIREGERGRDDTAPKTALKVPRRGENKADGSGFTDPGRGRRREEGAKMAATRPGRR